ncbi:MAG: hypothetical protein RL662_909 [Bacteroidota bacterium]|jgi:nitroreductase
MSDFSRLIAKRRSCRRFTEEPIKATDVELILKAGLLSPSSKNVKPCYFIAVENKDTLNKLSESKKQGSTFISRCPLAIVVAADPLASSIWIEDTSIASIMMQLQAEDLDIGSCWVQIRDRQTATGSSSEDYVKVILNIPIQLQVVSIVAFGHRAEALPPHSETDLNWDKVYIEKF